MISDGTDRRVLLVAARTGTFYCQKMTAGHIYAIAGDGQHTGSGDGGPALQAEFTFPTAVAAARSGDIYFARTPSRPGAQTVTAAPESPALPP